AEASVVSGPSFGFAGAGWDSAERLLVVARGAILRSEPGQRSLSVALPDARVSRVNAAALGPRGERLVTSGPQGTIAWSLAGEVPAVAATSSASRTSGGASLAWSADGERLACVVGERELHVLDRELRLVEKRRAPRGRFTAVSWSASGALAATVWLFNQDVQVRVAEPGQEEQVFQVPGAGARVAWTPAGDALAICSSGGGARDGQINRVHLWTRASGALELLPQPPAAVEPPTPAGGMSSYQVSEALAVSPDGALLAAASHPDQIGLYGLSERRLLRVLEGHSSVVSALAWTPAGEHLLSASSDGTLRVWARRGEPHALLRGHAATPGLSLYVSPSGETLLSRDTC
ncbi:MAG TPA: hypothetical protein DEA08_12325, partial [Planctomycetes bacterium]|nr:hypothetical protein [Planctomycetota bacterium]